MLSSQNLRTFLSLSHTPLFQSPYFLSHKCYVERRSVRDDLQCTLLSSFLLLLLSYVWVFFLASCFRNTPLNIQLPTSWSRVLPQKLTGAQLVKKFPTFYVTPNVRYKLTKACHLSISWARSIQFKPLSHTLKIHFNITLPPTKYHNVVN